MPQEEESRYALHPILLRQRITAFLQDLRGAVIGIPDVAAGDELEVADLCCGRHRGKWKGEGNGFREEK